MSELQREQMVIVDASVWVSQFVPDDINHHTSRQWLELHLAQGGQIAVPVLLFPEIAGAIARRTGKLLFAKRTLEKILQLSGLRILPVDQRLGLASADIAAEIGLRGADAIYYAIAEQLGIPLVTWDSEQISRAAKLIRVGTPLSLFPPSPQEDLPF